MGLVFLEGRDREVSICSTDRVGRALKAGFYNHSPPAARWRCGAGSPPALSRSQADPISEAPAELRYPLTDASLHRESGLSRDVVSRPSPLRGA
jgi:hypothetical protein